MRALSKPARREALAAGACEYIMKPFDGDIIQAKFAEAGLIAREGIAA